MGLFSFGSKEKPKTLPRREAKPDTITTLALQRNLGDADLDYLLATYAPETWEKIDLLKQIYNLEIKNAAYNELYKDVIPSIVESLHNITNTLDDISRRLDALEHSKEITERTL